MSLPVGHRLYFYNSSMGRLTFVEPFKSATIDYSISYFYGATVQIGLFYIDKKTKIKLFMKEGLWLVELALKPEILVQFCRSFSFHTFLMGKLSYNAKQKTLKSKTYLNLKCLSVLAKLFVPCILLSSSS